MAWRRPPGPGDADGEDPITLEDLALRIGATEARPAPGEPPSGTPPDIVDRPVPAILRPAPTAPTAPPDSWRRRRNAAVERRGPHAHPVVSTTTRRVLLWRDASMLLFVVVIGAFALQFALSRVPGDGASDTGGTRTGFPTQEAGGLTGVPTTEQPTIGPVVDPSLIQGIEATPTPRVSARPTLRPVTPPPAVAPPTTPPTISPTVTPTDAPTPEPSPSAPPTPEPPPSTPPPTVGPTPTAESTPTPVPSP